MVEQIMDEAFVIFEGRVEALEQVISGFTPSGEFDEPIGITGIGATAGYALPASVLGATTPRAHYNPNNDFLVVAGELCQPQKYMPISIPRAEPQPQYFMHECGIDLVQG